MNTHKSNVMLLNLVTLCFIIPHKALAWNRQQYSSKMNECLQACTSSLFTEGNLSFSYSLCPSNYKKNVKRIRDSLINCKTILTHFY